MKPNYFWKTLSVGRTFSPWTWMDNTAFGKADMILARFVSQLSQLDCGWMGDYWWAWVTTGKSYKTQHIPKKLNETGNYRRVQIQQQQVCMLEGDVIKMTEGRCSAARRPGGVSRPRGSSRIHFHSSDSFTCTNFIFACQLQAKWSLCPSAHSGITIQQASIHTQTITATLSFSLKWSASGMFAPPRHNPVVGNIGK